MVIHKITITQQILQNCYCVCDHIVYIAKERVNTLKCDVTNGHTHNNNSAISAADVRVTIL